MPLACGDCLLAQEGADGKPLRDILPPVCRDCFLAQEGAKREILRDMLPPVCVDCFLAQEVAKRGGIVVATQFREVSPPSTGFETSISGLEAQRAVHEAQKAQKTLKNTFTRNCSRGAFWRQNAVAADRRRTTQFRRDVLFAACLRRLPSGARRRRTGNFNEIFCRLLAATAFWRKRSPTENLCEIFCRLLAAIAFWRKKAPTGKICEICCRLSAAIAFWRKK